MFRIGLLLPNPKTAARDLMTTGAYLLAATIICSGMVLYRRDISHASEMYILFVLVISIRTTGYFWGLASAMVSTGTLVYFHNHLQGRADFAAAGLPLTLFALMGVALVACTLKNHEQEQREALSQREQRTAEMNRLSRILIQAQDQQEMIEATVDYFQSRFGSATYYAKGEGDRAVSWTGPLQPDQLVKEDRDALEQAFREHRIAVGSAGTVYFPVSVQAYFFGVLGLSHQELFLPEGIKEFIILLLTQLAMALERRELSAQRERIQMEKQAEQMRSNLLRAISHDLRTPLTGIIGASSALIDNGERIDPDSRARLLDDIHEDATWLLRMVENVLSLTKIGGSPTQLKKSPELAEEVLEQVVSRCKRRYPGIRLRIRLPDEVVMVPMDDTLVEQVLINLVDNAFRHGNPREPIELTLSCSDGWAGFSVRDRGDGVPEQELPTLFDGFASRNRGNCDDSRGFGIGLSICKSVAIAHGGRITAANAPEGGLRVNFTLPVEEGSFDEG